MKTTAYVLLLFVALALSVPGFAQAPDDNLIVPGQRIEEWTLGVTTDGYVQMTGAQNVPGALAPSDALAQLIIVGPETKLLGQQEAILPAAPTNIKVSELVVEPGASVRTHSHAMGWEYTVEGLNLLTIAGRTSDHVSGEAAWIPDGAEHTHDWHSTLRTRLCLITLGADVASALPSEYRTFAVAAVGLSSGAHTVWLYRISIGRYPPNWDVGTFISSDQPMVIIGISGSVRVGLSGHREQTLRGGEVRVFSDAWQVTNAPDQAGRVLLLRFAPKR